MSLKISFFSLIAFTGLGQLNAMENVAQSIEQKLLVLDAAIVKMATEVKIAKEQKNKDYLVFQQYKKNLPWYGGFNSDAPEVRAFKGELTFFSNDYDNKGSEGKYNTLLSLLTKNKDTYNKFKEDFKRGKRLNDNNYLQDVEKDLQTYLESPIFLICNSQKKNW